MSPEAGGRVDLGGRLSPGELLQQDMSHAGREPPELVLQSGERPWGTAPASVWAADVC